MNATEYKQPPGFYPELHYKSLVDGDYMAIRDCYLVSKYLPEPLRIRKGDKFGPSIPIFFRRLTPVDSNIVVMSAPHDIGYQTQPEGVSRGTWDLVAKEILDTRETLRAKQAGEEPKRGVATRVYLGLKIGGWYGWNKNKKELNENSQMV